MSWKYFNALVLSLPFTTSAFALIEQTIDEKKPFDAQLSTTTHNRISQEHGSIEKVFADASLFSVTIDPSSGSALICPLGDIEQPVLLTVVTGSGLVQDINTTAKKGPAERIVLKNPQEDEQVGLDLVALTHTASVDLLNAIIDGKIPLGYGTCPVDAFNPLTIPAPLQNKAIQCLEGPFETIRVYEITNLGAQPIVLHPDALKTEKDAWVFVSARELCQNGRAILIAGQAKE